MRLKLLVLMKNRRGDADAHKTRRTVLNTKERSNERLSVTSRAAISIARVGGRCGAVGGCRRCADYVGGVERRCWQRIERRRGGGGRRDNFGGKMRVAGARVSRLSARLRLQVF